MTAPIRAYIGVGGNLGNAIAHARAGIAALRSLPASRLIACSSLYRTAPVGITDQPAFINAVCALDTRLNPARLLEALMAIERLQGRVRGPVHGGPRTLDLDILLYGDLELATAEIAIPHPRLHERAFVLVPLQEIAPNVRVPGRASVSALLARCTAAGVTRLTDDAVEIDTAAPR